MSGRLLPAVAAFVLALAVMAPTAMAWRQFVDENLYLWRGSYFARKRISLDFSIVGSDPDREPGWDPSNHWTLSAPVALQVFCAASTALV